MSPQAEYGNQALHAIYRDIQRQRDVCLTQILRVLEPKATVDPEIAAVVTLLKPWIVERHPRASVPAKEDPCPDHADHQGRDDAMERAT